MTVPVAVRPGECGECLPPLPPDSTLCPNCRERHRVARYDPREPRWPTCTPCFFRPTRWRIPCTCTPTPDEKTSERS